MKTMRNNLWMMMVAWCLFIEGKEVFALMVNILALAYLYLASKNIKIIETLVLSCLFISVELVCINMTLLGVSLSSLFFLTAACVNVSLSYEFLAKLRLKSMYSIFIIEFVLQLIMTVLFIIMPITLMNVTAKFEAIMTVNVIFMPYTLILLIRLIQREYRIKTLRNNLETLKRRSMFDIKI